VPLQTLAQTGREVELEVPGELTIQSALDALEDRYPVLQGAIREHVTHNRRAFIRFFACGEDLSLDPPTTPLPEAVKTGMEPLLIVGAIAGGSAS
jgi:hypothetical protein